MSANITPEEYMEVAQSTLLRLAECAEAGDEERALLIFEELRNIGMTSPEQAASLLVALASTGGELLIYLKYGIPDDPDEDADADGS